MKFNKWTVGLAAVGVVSLASAARADEQMSMVQTALSQTTLSGYVDTAMQWNPGSDANTHTTAAGANIPHYAFAKDDGFSLNAVDVALDHPEDSSQWAAGYRVELMVGPNSEPLANAGIAGISIGGAAGGYGLVALRQAFVRLHTPLFGNGIDWQVGVFDSPLGYESTSDPSNPNYTRSYGYTIEPTTLTGILGTYKVNDSISLSAGIADMWNDDVIQASSLVGIAGVNSTPVVESQKTYIGSINLTAPDSMGFLKGATLSGGVIHGVNATPVATGNGGSETSWYVGATVPTPITQLKAGASFDYLMEAQNSPTAGNGGDDIWDGALYATFQATDKLSFNLRGEYLSDGSTTAATDLVSLYPGNKAEEITATIQYNLWANVITRAEFRWDHVEHLFPTAAAAGPTEGFGASGNGDPSRNDDFLLALNIIYQF